MDGGIHMARIVIADDDVDIRDLVLFKLTGEGHDVVAVADGVAALDVCRRLRPDLVVLDVMMPGKSGFDVVTEIRADPALADVPVVLLTARPREHTEVEGVNVYMTKPFSPRELAAVVTSLIT
jgi:two-component system, OmpR family, response regulator MtrA